MFDEPLSRTQNRHRRLESGSGGSLLGGGRIGVRCDRGVPTLVVAEAERRSFRSVICDVEPSEYLAPTGADPRYLVIVDPGSGFRCLFE